MIFFLFFSYWGCQEEVKFLLRLHDGSFFGDSFSVGYASVLALMSILLSVTGLINLNWFWLRRQGKKIRRRLLGAKNKKTRVVSEKER